MEEVHQVPPGATLLALPHVSKQGFCGATVSSLILGAFAGGLRMCRALFLADYGVVQARNASAETALDGGYEYLWFVDSDMDFPPQTLERLKACDADISCTDMWSRNIPSFRTVMRYSPLEGGGVKSLEHIGIEPISTQIADPNIQDVDTCGMACTLIKVSLLRKFRDAGQLWFESALHGEDASFCIRAKQQFGATIRCDFGVLAGHWGHQRIAGQNWTRDAKNGFGDIAQKDMLKRSGVRNLPDA